MKTETRFFVAKEQAAQRANQVTHAAVRVSHVVTQIFRTVPGYSARLVGRRPSPRIRRLAIGVAAAIGAASAASYVVTLFLLQPLNSNMPHYTGAAIVLALWTTALLPLHVTLQHPLAVVAKPGTWIAHVRRATHAAVALAFGASF